MIAVSRFRPFRSPKLLVERAQTHLKALEAEESAYVATKPFVAIKDLDPETGGNSYKVRVTHDIPEEASTIVFDIINCLRSALDHAVFDASARLSCNPNPKHTEFSFGETAEEAARKLNRNKANVPLGLHPYLMSFQPYKGGANAIWELNQVRNGKIHRMLAPMAVATDVPQIGRFDNRIGRMTSTGDANSFLELVSEWNPADRELTFLRTGTGLDIDAQVTVHIAFEQGAVFGGRPALGQLRRSFEKIERIVLGIEAETDRLSNLGA